MKIYSKRCEYAIRALSQIHYEGNSKPFSLKTVCRRARISESFTRKTFQALVRKKMLIAKHGPGGGYTFRLSPDLITLFDVIQAVDGKKAFNACISRDGRCGKKPCQMHAMWKRAKKVFVSELQAQTVGSLIKKNSKKEEMA